MWPMPSVKVKAWLYFAQKGTMSSRDGRLIVVVCGSVLDIGFIGAIRAKVAELTTSRIDRRAVIHQAILWGA